MPSDLLGEWVDQRQTQAFALNLGEAGLYCRFGGDEAHIRWCLAELGR